MEREGTVEGREPSVHLILESWEAQGPSLPCFVLRRRDIYLGTCSSNRRDMLIGLGDSWGLKVMRNNSRHYSLQNLTTRQPPLPADLQVPEIGLVAGSCISLSQMSCVVE